MGDKYHKHHVINEPEAEITREMVKRYLAGESLAQLCDDFERRGITAKSHKDKTGAMKPGVKWTTKTMAQYLHRPTLYGTRHNAEHPDQDVPAIISFADWQKVQDRMAERNRKTGGHGTPGMVSGTLLCGKCGNKMYLTNTGYYCRRCPKGERYLIPKATAEDMAVRLIGGLSKPEPVTERPVDNRQQRIDRLSADIQRTKPTSPDYLATVTSMVAEINELQADLERTPRLPVITRETGRTIGDAFLAETDNAKRRQFLLDTVRLTVRSAGKGHWQMTVAPVAPMHWEGSWSILDFEPAPTLVYNP